MNNLLQPLYRPYRTSSDESNTFIYMSTRAVLAGLLAAYLTSAAAATPQKAAGFYEDALRRFERQDTPGALI
ncbi:MAG: hypothetical protein ACXWCS_20070, partial [Burkholderiales bacterium]